MAELVIGAVVGLLVEKLASGIISAPGELIKLVLSAEIRSKLQKWSDTLTQIQAVLVDAGQKQAQNRSVELWLNRLQHLAYEIDDILDDLITEATRHQLNKKSHTSTSKVIKFIPNKLHAVKMSSKLDEVTTKLLDLLNQKQLLGLTDGVKPSIRASKQVEETSLVDESKIIGMEGDKEALLSKLLGSDSSSSQAQNVNVVSIVGLGGSGKTTLAQMLYKDKDVNDHFELMSWVCVSDEFDVPAISKAIYKDVGGDDEKFETLNKLQVALSEKLSRKRFLLVLDDVWSENYVDWELLQRPFTVGSPGSKILVTTRKSVVAEVMNSVEAYSLKLLSYEKALALFARYASGRLNFDVNGALELYGEDIVKKCGSLPLALIALGRVFRKKSNVEDWKELLNSEIWNSKKEPTVLPALKLSYYDLPPHLKQMFVYCCLFPKDYTFDKDELVLLWMAEGFLYESNGNNSMGSFGRECFEELLSRSFFQYSTNDKSLFTMHDLINDLAMSVAREFFLMLDGKTDVLNKSKDLEKCHHLSFICDTYGANKMFKGLKAGRRLRTILAMSVTKLGRWDTFYISNTILTEVLPKLQFLRVLSLAGYNIAEVPQFVCSLKHLRYLNFSKTEITCLPEQLGELLNLQSLLLSRCYELSSFPNSITKLINLRHLDISHTPKLNKMLLGMVGLEGLQTLSKIVIGDDDVFHISDLKTLLHLQGQLSIKGLHEVKDAAQAKEAKIQQRKGIRDLIMEWSDDFEDSRNKATEYEVLEGLRPFEKLRSLEISYYGGTKFPTWVGDPLFVCLTILTLHGCISCKRLPTLGHLPSLRELSVEGMDGFERLDFKFLGRFDSCQADVAFPSLEVLKFKDMKSWEEWSTSGGDIAGAFPCLREIHMIDCEKLDAVTIELIPSLQVLHVEGCSIMMLRSMVSVSPSVVRLTMKKIKGLTQLTGEVLEHLKAVEYLNISYCDELTRLFGLEAAESCRFLLSLKKLEVSECVNLVSLGEKEMQSVKEVEISRCERLESYNCPSSNERLDIYSCKSLTSLSFPTMDDLPSTLKRLKIVGCDKLEVSWLANNFLSSLEHLTLQRLPNLRLFPEGCLVHLTELEIVECDNIESIPDNGYGFLPNLCLKKLRITWCNDLKSFPHKHLQSLGSLEEMKIRDCPSLDESFPCGLWPPNLSELFIGGLKKPISEWGVQNFPTSLVTLRLFAGDEDSSGLVSFGKAEEPYSSSLLLLPSSLTSLAIWHFKEMESVREEMQHLTSLQRLSIWDCPKVRDLPEKILPSLSYLRLSGDVSPVLMKKCSRSRKGKYWPIISQIPDLRIPRE